MHSHSQCQFVCCNFHLDWKLVSVNTRAIRAAYRIIQLRSPILGNGSNSFGWACSTSSHQGVGRFYGYYNVGVVVPRWAYRWPQLRTLGNNTAKAAPFPPSLGDAHRTHNPHSSNAMESFHAHYNGPFYHPQPHLYEVTSVTHDLQIQSDLKIYPATETMRKGRNSVESL